MASRYNHTQRQTWKPQTNHGGADDGYGGDGRRGTTFTFAPPRAYVTTTTETVVEKYETRPFIVDYNKHGLPPGPEPAGSVSVAEIIQTQPHASAYDRGPQPRVEPAWGGRLLRRPASPPRQHHRYSSSPPKHRPYSPPPPPRQTEVRSRPMATRPTKYWQQQGPRSTDDPRRHDADNYGNDHRDRRDGYVVGDDRYDDGYDRPDGVGLRRLPPTTDFRPDRPILGAPLTSATNDINTAVRQLKELAGPPKDAANTGAGGHGFGENKRKPRFRVSVPRNEMVYADRREGSKPNNVAPQANDTREANKRYGRRLPPSRLLSTVDDYSPDAINTREAARLYNGALIE